MIIIRNISKINRTFRCHSSFALRRLRRLFIRSRVGRTFSSSVFSHYRCFRYCENGDYYDDLDCDDYCGCCYDCCGYFGFSLLGSEANKPFNCSNNFANNDGSSDLRSTGAGAAVGIDRDTVALSITLLRGHRCSFDIARNKRLFWYKCIVLCIMEFR